MNRTALAGTLTLMLILLAGVGYGLLRQPDATSEENGSLSAENRPPLPTTCVSEPEGAPVITGIAPRSGMVGTVIEITGCNFAGFEGDKNARIENERGESALLRGGPGSTGETIVATLDSPLCRKDTSYSGLPCDAWLDLLPGTYRIYATAWGKESNAATFAIITE